MKCPDCNGQQKNICRNCHKLGYVLQMNPIMMIKFGISALTNQICYVCGGNGKVNCKRCNGTGEVPDK